MFDNCGRIRHIQFIISLKCLCGALSLLCVLHLSTTNSLPLLSTEQVRNYYLNHLLSVLLHTRKRTESVVSFAMVREANPAISSILHKRAFVQIHALRPDASLGVEIAANQRQFLLQGLAS